MTDGFIIEALQAAHERTGFASGVETLDRYLTAQAGQDMRRDVASCYVACAVGSPQVLGYYTISMAGTSLQGLPDAVSRKLPKYESIPAALIGRLAVDRSRQGQGLGSILLLNAVTRALRSDIAAFAVVVHAKDESAAEFYRHHGFVPLVGERLRLFISLAEAVKRFKLK